MSRREFTRSVKLQIIKRASHPHGPVNLIVCEKCGSFCPTFEIDHIIPDGLSVDKSKALTAADGQLLCKACHKEKTKREDEPAIAKAKRREAAHWGARRPKQKIKSNASLRGPERAHEKRAPVAALSGIWRQVIGEAE